MIKTLKPLTEDLSATIAPSNEKAYEPVSSRGDTDRYLANLSVSKTTAYCKSIPCQTCLVVKCY